MVMEALAELWGDLEALKKERHMAPAGGAASARVDVHRPRTEVIGDDSRDSPGFSRFQSVQQLDSSSETQDELTTGSVLQSVRSYRPLDNVSD